MELPTRKALTPEQIRRRAEVNARNAAIQRTALKQPKSGIWGGKVKDAKPS